MTKVVKRFENCSLDNYEAKTEEQKRLVKVIADGIKNGFKNNIIITGGVGTGKTHIAFSILNELEYKQESPMIAFKWYSEKNVIYRRAKEIIDDIKRCWNDVWQKSPVETLSEIPLLIIDEVGVQYGSDSERTELYDIFNNRYENMLTTIIISNNDTSALQAILGQRIYDRLSSGAIIFKLTGESFR